MDQLTALKIFVNVAEFGSFSAAADRMGVSRAAASKQVSQLESMLGGRLLNRTTRRVSLTESGRLYFERCREILGNLEEADNVVAGLAQEPRGNLRISVPTNFAAGHLLPLVAEFMSTYPEVRVEMICGERLVDIVDEGFDLAIRMTKLNDSSLIARRLAKVGHVVVASPEYLAKNSIPRIPDDLAKLDCLMYSNRSSDVWPFTKGGMDYSVKVNYVFATNNPDTLLAAAVSGLGVALIPTFVAGEAIRQGKLTSLLQDFKSLRMELYAVYSSRRFLPAKIRVFVDFLSKKITDPPYWEQGLTVRV